VGVGEGSGVGKRRILRKRDRAEARIDVPQFLHVFPHMPVFKASRSIVGACK
jgi:hypothetical protein